jgi:ornithine cyclodeaminase/alanine dehydrogenase-like protein (mu-crystallin family)
LSLPIVGLDAIRAAATPQLVFGAVRDALIAHAEGRTSISAPMHLAFPNVDGDCHVKAGHLIGSPHFVVKIACGFYNNPGLGLASNNGLMLVLSATTGAPLAVLADDGWLTAWRTAAAGALITHALTPASIDEVAVLGTGLQAKLQIEWLNMLRPLNRVHVWGRRPAAAERLAVELNTAGIDARPSSLADAAGSPCVITATAATTPLATPEAFDATVHVTAIGADMPGKNELPPALFARAATIATDDHDQCLDHGDFGTAVRTKHTAPHADTAVGAILRADSNDATLVHAQDHFSIADLTGIAATDAAVTTAILAVAMPDENIPDPR